MSAKALSLANDIRDELVKRFSGVLTVGAVQFDTDLLPYVLVGAGTAGSQSALLKIADILPVGFNAIGQAAVSYGNPCKIQAVLETSAVSNVPLLTGANITQLLGMLAHRGSRIELYQSANGTAVAIAQITSGNLKTTFEPDLKYKTTSQI
jgi:hypothetical protein